MLKIAVIQRFLPSQSRGGVGYFTHGLCNALQQRGHIVTVFSHDPAPYDALYQVSSFPLTRAILGYPSSPWTFPFQIAKQDFSAFDIIHAQGDEHLITRAGPPIVRTMHGSALAEAIHNGWRARSPKRFFMHLYFYGCELIADLRANAVVGVSKETSHHYPRIHGVIPNGVEIEHFSQFNGRKSENPSILFVGDLDSRKRGKFLLGVFHSHVKPNVPEAELWLVCPDKVEGDGVRCFGIVPPEHLARLYAEAWVFCLPSSYEGFGRPYVEAMAAGTPVVAASNPGAREVLDNGRFGLIVSDGELGDTLCRLITDSRLREKFSQRGIDRAKDYSWENVAEQYERVYKGVLKGRKTVAVD
ncbi:MAG: glycosyltransferase family 4 protein [Candidatus Binatia bacterium]